MEGCSQTLRSGLDGLGVGLVHGGCGGGGCVSGCRATTSTTVSERESGGLVNCGGHAGL